MMRERDFLSILGALARQIEEMELQMMWKDMRIKELEERLGIRAKENTGVNFEEEKGSEVDVEAV